MVRGGSRVTSNSVYKMRGRRAVQFIGHTPSAVSSPNSNLFIGMRAEVTGLRIHYSLPFILGTRR